MASHSYTDTCPNCGDIMDACEDTRAVLNGISKIMKEKLPDAAERVKRSGHGMANATRGRARTFKHKKKEQSKNACRGKNSQREE